MIFFIFKKFKFKEPPKNFYIEFLAKKNTFSLSFFRVEYEKTEAFSSHVDILLRGLIMEVLCVQEVVTRRKILNRTILSNRAHLA